MKIRSVQRGTTTSDTTVSISAVKLQRAWCYGGMSGSTNGIPAVRLSSTTAVTIMGNSGVDALLPYQVTEVY
jgi:hypothetical protein